MRFVLNKNTSNNITVTLNDKSLLTDPYYLFEFWNEQSKVKKYLIAQSNLSSEDRYNEYAIVETTSPDPLLGEVNLEVGSYFYTVYEQYSNTNLDPTGLNIVEQGLCSCEDLSSSTSKIYDTTTTNKVYNG